MPVKVFFNCLNWQTCSHLLIKYFISTQIFLWNFIHIVPQLFKLGLYFVAFWQKAKYTLCVHLMYLPLTAFHISIFFQSTPTYFFLVSSLNWKFAFDIANILTFPLRIGALGHCCDFHLMRWQRYSSRISSIEAWEFCLSNQVFNPTEITFFLFITFLLIYDIKCEFQSLLPMVAQFFFSFYWRFYLYLPNCVILSPS